MVEKSSGSSFWPSLYDPFRAFATRVSDWIAPASEATSDDGGYRITLELPGVEEKNIDLSVANGVVTVKGEKSSEREEKGDTWFFSERQYGSFSRSFTLPNDADESGLNADLKDGVLTITVPKAKGSPPGARKVAIGKK
jgi:HSP20 family protein